MADENRGVPPRPKHPTIQGELVRAFAMLAPLHLCPVSSPLSLMSLLCLCIVSVALASLCLCLVSAPVHPCLAPCLCSLVTALSLPGLCCLASTLSLLATASISHTCTTHWALSAHSTTIQSQCHACRSRAWPRSRRRHLQRPRPRLNPRGSAATRTTTQMRHWQGLGRHRRASLLNRCARAFARLRRSSSGAYLQCPRAAVSLPSEGANACRPNRPQEASRLEEPKERETAREHTARGPAGVRHRGARSGWRGAGQSERQTGQQSSFGLALGRLARSKLCWTGQTGQQSGSVRVKSASKPGFVLTAMRRATAP